MERPNVKRKPPEESHSKSDESKRAKLGKKSKVVSNDKKQVRKLTDVVANFCTFEVIY